MGYLRNTWYAAGWSDEVGESPLRRKLLGETIAFFRDSRGEIHAIGDRCPHRFAPLSRGQVIGDSLQCPYHGLRFDGSGKCVHNPHGNGTIPRAAQVPFYPVTERHGVIWIWMGEQARAEPATIPDFSLIDESENYVGRGYLHVRANYQLGSDNIMDLSHIAYVHRHSLGGDEMQRSEMTLEVDGHTIWSRRRNHGEKLPPAVLDHYGSDPETLWDRSFDVRWNPPASLLLLVSGVPSGQSLEGKRALPFAHLFTPETDATTHYWFAASYPRALGPAHEARARKALAFLAGPFEHEDLPMLEGQQEALGDRDFWALKPVMLAGDAAAVRARRLLARLIEEEQETETAVVETSLET